MKQHRVKFDFEIEFANGGGLQGQAFRLDIAGDAIDDRSLGDLIVADLRLLMVAAVRIRNKEIVSEQHKRVEHALAPDAAAERLIDLNHVIESGMITYRGLPAPLVCDFMSREASQPAYSPGTSFHIARLEMVANTGTYLDSPYHRFAHGEDVSELALARLAGLEALVVNVAGMSGRPIGREVFLPFDVRGKAVLVHTGWARHWRTDAYFEGHPFLTECAARHLRERGAALVGIDSLNIDDISGGERPVHTTLLGGGIPIVEHLCNLERVPAAGARFSAVPPRVKGMGTFPVRAYARLPGA
ncbi:MAG TPA: cyclase family protein [Steroidobacteraceae bacterium]|jgi:kynurenine formamidase